LTIDSHVAGRAYGVDFLFPSTHDRAAEATSGAAGAHFGAKNELLAEICSRGIASALRALDSVLALDLSSTGRLAELTWRFVTAVLESQKHSAIFAREELNLLPADFHRISDMRRDFDHKLSTLLDEGVANGEFEVPDTRVAALAIGGMVSWAYVWYWTHGRLTLPDVAEQITQLVLATVQARPAKQPPKRATGRKTTPATAAKCTRRPR
jgi:AcrR family transcriptional regulator